MKNHPISKALVKVLAVVGILGYSCGNSGAEQHLLDSIKKADSIHEAWHERTYYDPSRWADSCFASYATTHDGEMLMLEELFEINSEAELKNKYGLENVKYDTIWGAEGFFSMGTILKTDAESHIEITWENEKTKTGIISVTQVSDQDWYEDSLQVGMWYSGKGITIGMPIRALESVNQSPFTFSGFGWDYAGTVLDWQKGNLEGKGIAVQLSEGRTDENLSDTEAATILGDVEVQSDNPTALKFHPRVWSISVAKMQ